jgi:hypothetical protein
MVLNRSLILLIFEHWKLPEALLYIKKHRIKNIAEYSKHAKTTPYLLTKAHNYDGFVGKLMYYKPTHFEEVLDKNEDYKKYVEVAESHVMKGANLINKRRIIKRFLLDYMLRNDAPAEPLKFLHETHKTPTLEGFMEEFSATENRTGVLSIINEYVDALLLEYCTDYDEDEGTTIFLPGCHNPFAKQNVSNDGQKPKPSQTVKAILPLHYVQKARELLCADHDKTFDYTKGFGDLHKAVELYNCDYFEVDKSLIDESDPSCVWREREVKRYVADIGKNVNFNIYEIWSPVRTIAMYTLFSLPIRGQQILWNDSGEADVEVPIIFGEEIKWIKNTHPLAGRFVKPQGFIKKYTKDGKDDIGFNATTNKTKRHEGGYSVPYMPKELAYWLIKLREWQGKYNPITSPAKWSDIKEVASNVNHRRLKERGFEGNQCFLFRDPSARHDTLRNLPIQTKTFQNSLPILLFMVQEDKLPLASKNEGSATNLTSYTSDYTPHSLRASIITALITDCGVAVPIVSQLVGHASIIMTIYYNVIRESHMRKELSEAQLRGMAKSRESVDMAILENQFKNIASQFVDNVSGELVQNLNHNIRNTQVLTFDYGICPVGGQCEEGGEQFKDNVYGPVVPGYLGRQNCPRCRFFVTGSPFLGGLKTLADEIALEAKVAASKMNEAEELMEALCTEQYDAEETGTVFLKQAELLRKRSLYYTRATKFDELTIDLIHVYRLADGCIKLLNKAHAEGNKNLPMVVNQNDEQLGLMPEEVSIFRSLDTVCKNAELYAFADPSRAIPSRSQILDALASDNDFHFGLFKLTDQQQLDAGNQITRLLMERLGSWDKLDRVADGENFLSDFVGGGELKHLTRDLALLANESIPGLKVIDGGKNV